MTLKKLVYICMTMDNNDLQKISLLYVDDEVYNLNAFYAYFRVKKEYEIHTCRSGREGLQILNERKIHIVIADQRMPLMTGIEFLEEATLRNFDPVKIVVTAHRDTTVIQNAYREGRIFSYHEKPWSFETIEASILKACEIYFNR